MKNMKKKQPIKILDIDFNLLGEIDDYESFYFIRQFSFSGEFELTINRNKNNVKYLKKGNIIYLQNKKCGIIEYRGLKIGESISNDTLVVKGVTLEKILSMRITDVPSGQESWLGNGNAETVMKNLVDYNLGNANKPERSMSIVGIADNKQRGNQINVASRYENLDEKIGKISQENGLGILFSYDYYGKKFIFDVYEGVNRTSSQTEIPPVLFSVDFGNISSQTLVDSKAGFKNVAIVAGQGEGVNREIEIVNNEHQGLDRYELFVDARDIGSDSNTTLKERGLEKLKEHEAIYTLEGSILPFNSFKFEEDYFLGDIVTIKFYDIEDVVYLDSRITKVKEYWNNNGYSVEVTFGNNIPNLIDKIKSINKQTISRI